MADLEFEDAELINGFREESLEHIEVVETKLLDLESIGFDRDVVNTIFRSIHTIKGGSGFLGFEAIKDISHKMENLLDQVRNEKIPMTDAVSDVLLRGTDLLKAMLEDLANQDEIDCGDVMEKLKVLLDPKAGQAEEACVSAPDTGLGGGNLFVTEDEAKGFLNKGFHIYLLPLEKAAQKEKMAKKDFTQFKAYLNSFGTLLWEDGNLEVDGTTHATILFATALDKEFASASLRADEDKIQGIDKSKIAETFAKLMGPPPQAKPVAPAPKQAAPAPPPAAKVSAAPAPSPAKKVEVAAPVPAPAPVADKTASKSRKVNVTQTDSTVRVSTNLLAKLMTLAGELILCRNQLVQKMENRDLAELHSLNQRLSELQESVMQTRLQQVGAVFNKVPRMVRDLSRSLGKQIEVMLEGVEVELDRTIIDSITDPLTHLVRNSIDHGIEGPQERMANGKPAHGTLTLRAYHEGGQVNLEIQDDGRGINTDILKRKALEKGLCTAAEIESMGKREALNIIFRPGFSTAAEVTEISGRGVGMDVVKTTFENLGGTVDLNSELGHGTTIQVKLPTTLAIVSAVIIDTEGHVFALPQTNIEEIVRLKEFEMASKLERVGNYEIFRLRGMLLPVVRLADVLGINRTFIGKDGRIYQDRRQNIADRRHKDEDVPEEIRNKRTGGDRRQEGRTFYVVVLRVGVNKYGLLINRIKDVEEVVVKPLSSFLKYIKCFHGSTILGDGRVINILDVNGIASMSELRFEKLQDLAEKDTSGHQHRDQQSFLIFNNHQSEFFALPLSFITRIERVNQKNIEYLGEDEFIQVGNKNVPLFRLEKKLKCKPGTPDEDGTLYLLIPNLVRSSNAIVATKVQDVVSTNVEVQREVVKRPGILGTTIINGKMTQVLDIYGLFDEKRATGMMSEFRETRVLLAEDTPFFRTMIRSYLEELGMEVDEADNGKEAWEKVQHGHYDLVLSDIEMPIMNGFELVSKIKAQEQLAHIPCMAITALDDQDSLMKGQQAGFDAYQVKLDRDALVKTVKQLLSAARNAK